jgi:hypothetical protein
VIQKVFEPIKREGHTATFVKYESPYTHCSKCDALVTRDAITADSDPLSPVCVACAYSQGNTLPTPKENGEGVARLPVQKPDNSIPFLLEDLLCADED